MLIIVSCPSVDTGLQDSGPLYVDRHISQFRPDSLDASGKQLLTGY